MCAEDDGGPTFAGMLSQSDGFPCRFSSTRLQTGATDIDQCSCNVGYYAVPQGVSRWSAGGDRGESSNLTAASGETLSLVCQVCGVGSNCSVDGLTTSTLPLLSGYWRTKPTSQSIYRCFDASSGNSGCVGGTDRLCKPTLTGVAPTALMPTALPSPARAQRGDVGSR